jgi:hypothetical protein
MTSVNDHLEGQMKDSLVIVGVGKLERLKHLFFWVVEEKGPLERRLALGGNIILQRT